ncbi:MAG: 50S ribosomal protein L25 [Pseudobdellovibrionaceae bacterium]
MKRVDLNIEPREPGKANSREFRNNSKVPGVVYGATTNMNVMVHVNDILKYNTRNYENALFNLKSSDSKANGKVVLLKEVQVHPVTRRPEHVDLFAIDLNKAVRIDVEISLTGKAIGLAEGGLLNVVNRTITIEVLPNDIPENLTADISHLGVGDALHVSDLKVPAGVKIISPIEMTIAVINIAQEEAVAPTTEAAPAAAAAAAAPAAAKDAKAADPKAAAKTPAAKAPAKK